MNNLHSHLNIYTKNKFTTFFLALRPNLLPFWPLSADSLRSYFVKKTKVIRQERPPPVTPWPGTASQGSAPTPIPKAAVHVLKAIACLLKDFALHFSPLPDITKFFFSTGTFLISYRHALIFLKFCIKPSFALPFPSSYLLYHFSP